jgi:hypothetical protein
MTEYSQAYQRLRHYIAERMRISHIYQPLMLMELLGRSRPAPALKISGRQKFKGFLEGFTSRPLDLDVMHLCHPECRKL